MDRAQECCAILRAIGRRNLHMSGFLWNARTAQKVMLGLICIIGTLQSASALPPTPNNSGLTAQQCYRKDSGCTQFCGAVTGDLRYECFGICDRMLDHCLDTGDWTDSEMTDPGTGKPPSKGGLLSGFFVRIIMTLADTDGDGVLSPKEIQSVKKRLFGELDAPDKQ